MIITLGYVKKDAISAQLAGRTVALAMEGSRKFRMSNGIGVLPYEGCSVLVFHKIDDRKGHNSVQQNKPEDDKLEAWLQANTQKWRTVAGLQVAEFQDRVHQDRWKILVARPEPHIVLCATSESFLRSVLERRRRTAAARAKTTRALPAHLPEWKQLDRAARYWSVRHYDRG